VWRRQARRAPLKLKADQSMSERQVLAATQRVADGVTDFYGGERVEAHYEPDYLASAGTDARFRHEGQAASGLLIGSRIMRDMRDRDYGVYPMRIAAHEAAHSLSGVQPGPLPGFSQTVEEGGAEVLSLWFWKHRGQPFDARDRLRVEGRWTEPGAESLAHSVAYREEVADVLRRAGGRVGWDRDAVVDEVQNVFKGDHNARIRWRDSTDPGSAPPAGVGGDGLSLARWLLGA
jgi:hypothetical protein